MPASSPSGPVEVGLLLEVVLDHHAHELLEVDFRLPTELLMGLGRVADKEIYFRGAHEAGVLLDVLLPVRDADVPERGVKELADRVGDTGTDAVSYTHLTLP